MALPWVRLDSNIASHDKILYLLADPSAARWQAAASYMFALGWSGAQGTDGFVPKTALIFVHGTTKTARLLEKYGLWEESRGGWQIKNYGQRQQLSVVSDAKAAQIRQASAKANCVRWHGDSCWHNGACRKLEAI
jgi:hypothetical protein